jgi:transposase
MPKALELQLTSEQRETLLALCTRHPKPYLRERAAALLKIAQGLAGYEVARSGLLQPRREQTVSTWLHRYEQYGLGGLYNRPGRGRKPAFSPSAPDG